MLASLNSLRVLAEFWVVHSHLAPTPELLKDCVHDLMSFFFVLSGFVITYAHQDDHLSTWTAKRAFWWRRWSKTYPTYLLLWCTCLVYHCATNPPTTTKVTLCYITQLFAMNNWIGCGCNIMNPPSWYIATLYWAWLAFPWLHAMVRRVASYRPWTVATCLWLVSIGLNTGALPLGYWWIYTHPLLRVFEFTIGCIAATTLPTRLHWLVPTIPLASLVAVYAALYAWSIDRADECDHTPFHAAAPDSYGCTHQWYRAFVTKTALAWAVFIHYLAASEQHDQPHCLSGVLRNGNLLCTLSTFSLQLYLCHHFVFRVIHDVTRLTIGNIGLHLIFILDYCCCYLYYVYVQTLLDRGEQALTNRVSQWSPLSQGSTPLPSPVTPHE
jgi:peptidoglycan/LPS O-acetylase OafA/YrhL